VTEREGWAWCVRVGKKLHWKGANGVSLCNQVTDLGVPFEPWDPVAWRSLETTVKCRICSKMLARREAKEASRDQG
jgi:hypothetical protein